MLSSVRVLLLSARLLSLFLFLGSSVTKTATANSILPVAELVVPEIGPGASEPIFFGYAVAISGTTMVVGALQDLEAAYVFEKSKDDGTWLQTQKLAASDGGSFDLFGAALAIAGTTIVIGAFQNDIDGASNAGAAYVFEKSNGMWPETETLRLLRFDGNAEEDRFGCAVATDGMTIVVGAFFDDDNGTSSGSAYIFEKLFGGTWIPTQKLLASDGAETDMFGGAVAIDGTTIVIGAYGNGSNGSAYIFEKSNNVWLETTKLIASDGGLASAFGYAVAIDGTTIVVGAYEDDNDGGDRAGAAYVFEKSDDAWPGKETKLVASDAAAFDRLGYAVAIDGTTIVVGAYQDDNISGSSAGAVYVFEKSTDDETWPETQKLLAPGSASEYSNSEFGYSVGTSSGIVVVGAPFYFPINKPSSGAAYVYEIQTLFAISAIDTSLPEGDSGTTTFTFEVARRGGTTGTTSVNYAISGDVDESDLVDGTLLLGTLTFGDGISFQSITVEVNGDTDIESDETIVVTISDAANGEAIIAATATAIVEGDDNTFDIAAVDLSGVTTLAFNVSRSGSTSGATSVEYAVSDNVDGSDFSRSLNGGESLPSGTVNFDVGEVTQTVVVQVKGGNDIESDETFTMTLSSPANGESLGVTSATTTIENDDVVPPTTFSVFAVDTLQPEGNTDSTKFVFALVRSGSDTTVASSVDYTVSGTVDGTDFEGGELPSGTVSFASGDVFQPLDILVAGDADFEPNETFTVTISNPTNGEVIAVASATATIENDDIDPGTCTDDSDCVGGGLGFACDAGTCVPCLTNIQCRTNTDDTKLLCLTCADMDMPGTCTSSDHVCMDCDTNGQCLNAGRGRACVDKMCVGCKSNWQCRNRGEYEGDYCVESECVECQSNGQCSDSLPFCVGSTCVECSSNGQCRNADAGLACVDNACVGCTANWQCRNAANGELNKCVGNTCVA